MRVLQKIKEFIGQAFPVLENPEFLEKKSLPYADVLTIKDSTDEYIEQEVMVIDTTSVQKHVNRNKPFNQNSKYKHSKININTTNRIFHKTTCEVATASMEDDALIHKCKETIKQNTMNKLQVKKLNEDTFASVYNKFVDRAVEKYALPEPQAIDAWLNDKNRGNFDLMTEYIEHIEYYGGNTYDKKS